MLPAYNSYSKKLLTIFYRKHKSIDIEDSICSETHMHKTQDQIKIKNALGVSLFLNLYVYIMTLIV